MTRQERQILKDLQLKHKMAKYPNMKPEMIALTHWNDNSANELTKSVIAFLQFNGCQAERINTMGVYRKKYRTDGVAIGGQWTKGTGTPGSADISATIKGRSVKIEIKYGKDRQSQAQKDYQKAIEEAGGTYIIVKTFADMLNFYNEFTQVIK
jgi:hypothetical protein